MEQYSGVLISDVKALTFDVFGTVVDWRGSASREIASLASERGLELDPDLFADEWPAGYGPGMNKVRTGESAVDWHRRHPPPQ
ncbi:MAG: hypothetical protein VCF24_11750, partial [Candidatus Latescibacterota bacterium]